MGNWASLRFALGFSVGSCPFVFFGHYGRCELRQSQLLRTCSKTWEKMPFSSTGPLSPLPAHDVGAIHDGYVPHETDAHYFLLQRLGSLILDEEVGDLLVAGNHISAGGNADELRSQDQFQCILIALGDGVAPAVFHLLHLAKFGRRRIGLGRLLRCGDHSRQ